MNRFIRRDTASLLRSIDDDDEEKLYERQALIDDQELCQDETDLVSSNPFKIRQRVSSNKGQSISNNNDREGHELRNLNGKSRDLISEPVIEYTRYDIQPGDSLQSICLRYACSVNQVKRINGLMTDQDFHGLRWLKLPLGKLGLLEDVLKSQQQQNTSSSGIEVQAKSSSVPFNNNRSTRIVNSPGSALSVSSVKPQFKPLLSPGFSSDRINELNNKNLNTTNQNGFLYNDDDHHHYHLNIPTSNNSSGRFKVQNNHSHSSPSLRDFISDDINIHIEASTQRQIDAKQLKHKNFIRTELDQSNQIDNLLMLGIDENVDKVFQDLDYHVERAKVAAETYDRRAADLVNRIDTTTTSSIGVVNQTRVSKIPELFFSSENCGLNYKKLLVFIFIVCLVVPLVYVNHYRIVWYM